MAHSVYLSEQSFSRGFSMVVCGGSVIVTMILFQFSSLLQVGLFV